MLPAVPSSEVYLEDCVKALKRFNDKHFDLAIVDPPYGLGEKITSGGTWAEKLTKKDSAWDTVPSKEFFCELRRVSKEQIIWGGNYFADYLPATRGWIYWNKGQDGLTMSDGELAWTSEDKPLRAVTVNRASLIGSVHPTQKPLQVIIFALDYLSSAKNVLDLFGGSGSTLIACEQTDRVCFMMEFDPKYCDVIIARWEKLTGKQAQLIEG